MHIILKSHIFRLRLVSYAIGFLGFTVLASQVSAKTPAIAVAAAKTSAMDKIVPRNYLCYDHNVRLPVTYIETAGGSFYAILQVEGKQVSMTRQVLPQADKNAPQKYFYLSLDEQDSYRWYPQGDTGRLGFLAADDSAKEEMVYKSCKISKND